MKQKIVIKISMNGSKSRTRAMKIAVSVPGVSSIQLDGDDKIVVTGEGIDSTCLTVQLRKKVGYTYLVSVTPVTEAKKEDKKEEKKAPSSVQHMGWYPYPYEMHQQPHWHGTAHPVWFESRYYYDDQANCAII